MDESDVVRALAALAQVHRLRAFRQLVAAGSAGLTPSALAELLLVQPNNLSFHLKELGLAGLIHPQRQGRNLIYRADFERTAGLLAYLTENCCQGQPCLPTPLVCDCEGAPS